MTTAGAIFRAGLWGQGRRARAVVAVAGFCGHQLAEVLVPVAVGLIIDRAIATGDPAVFASGLASLAAVFVFLILSWQIGDRSGTRVYAEGAHALRQRVLGQALRRRIRRPAGEVLTVSSTDAGQAAGLFWTVAEQAAAATAVLVAGLTLVAIAWPLAVAVVIGTLAQAFVVHLCSGGLRRRGYEAQRRAAALDAVSTDLALGLRVLSALGGTQRATVRYVRDSIDAAEATYRAERAAAGLAALNLLVSGLAFTGIAALGGSLAMSGAISVGGFITAIGLAQTIRGPLQSLGHLPAQIAAKHGSAMRIAEIVDEAAESAVSGGEQVAVRRPRSRRPVGEGPASGSLGGDDAVAARLGLPDRTIEIRAGEVTGISADAETAVDLVDLFGGRRPPRPGELVVDGEDARHIGVAELRAAVFAPPHDATVFTGTAADNIAGSIDPERIAASAFDEVVARLPAGLDERVGERGMLLSGGQRQRLLLARALHQPQAVLVLHEPTTAIDPVTEADLAARLAAHGRTVVLITDRPTLLAACHRVYDLRATRHD